MLPAMSKDSQKACRPRSLVRGRVARIDLCPDCGCVSLHVGPTTIRMDEHALRSFWLTVGEAVEALDEPMLDEYAASPIRGSA
jgi:hypothetical protein